MTAAQQRFESLFFVQRNGLKLHVRMFPARHSSPESAAQYRRPLVCLPGLTRNGRDFDVLALALSGGPAARDVYTLDYRGRGLSDSDPDWRNYTVPAEMHDVIDFMTARGLAEPGILGTSRGGLITMILAAAQPSLVGPVILNDIGPVIEQRGLSRIASYVGRTPLPRDWSEAARLVRDMNIKAFPAVPDEEWEPIARQLFNEKSGRPAPGYDPELSRAFSVLDGPMPALWPQFEALARVPIMVVRGANSDILSAETVDAMRQRHRDLTELTIAGQGHAPWLRDEPSIHEISNFLLRWDEAHPA